MLSILAVCLLMGLTIAGNTEIRNSLRTFSGNVTVTENLEVDGNLISTDISEISEHKLLIAHTFNNASIPNVSGNYYMFDSSNNMKHSTAYNGVVYDDTEGALVFDGDDDYVRLNDYGDVFNFNQSKYTVSLWLKSNVSTGTNRFMGDTGYNFYLATNTATNTFQIIYKNVSGDAVYSATCANNFIITEKTRITFTWDPESGYILYANGKECNSGIFGSGINNVTADYRLGAGPGATNYWNGTIYDFTAWERILSADEIQAQYNQEYQFDSPKIPMVNNLKGTGDAYLCVNENGTVFRKNSTCV